MIPVARRLFFLFGREGFKYSFLGEGKVVSDSSKASYELVTKN